MKRAEPETLHESENEDMQPKDAKHRRIEEQAEKPTDVIPALAETSSVAEEPVNQHVDKEELETEIKQSPMDTEDVQPPSIPKVQNLPLDQKEKQEMKQEITTTEVPHNSSLQAVEPTELLEGDSPIQEVTGTSPPVLESPSAVPNNAPQHPNFSLSWPTTPATNAIPSPLTPSGDIPDGPEDKFAKQKHAMDFLYKVRVQYSSNPGVYNQFLEIMKDFKSAAIDTPEVIGRVKTLFRGNDYLIQEFNAFLPPGYKIEPDEPEQKPEPAENTVTDLEHARNYVRKIKNRFALQPHIYKSFLEILHAYYQQQHSITEVLESVQELFGEHPDLLEEFKQFLPKAVGDSSLVGQLGVPSATPRVPTIKKPKRKKIEKKKEEKRKRVGRNLDEDEDLIRDAVPPPPSRRYERNHAPLYERSEEKYIPKKQESYGFGKEFAFLSAVRKKIGSKNLYQEFLKLVTMYNQGAITKLELLQMARFLLGRYKDLYQSFKQFIAFDEEDPFEKEPLPENGISAQDNTHENDGQKNEEEEDETNKLALMYEMNAATMRAFEALAEFPDQPAAKCAVEKLDVIHLRTVERLYGERGSEVVEALQNDPLGVIPVIVKRLRQKNQEWKKWLAEQ